MLPKKFRLPGFRVPQALAGNPLYLDANLVIKVLPNQLKFSRVAVIISSRFLGKAAKRNRLKRQLLALINPIKITPGFDIVILIKK